jgi:hypothetical protein
MTKTITVFMAIDEEDKESPGYLGKDCCGDTSYTSEIEGANLYGSEKSANEALRLFSLNDDYDEYEWDWHVRKVEITYNIIE